jgi:glycosyltransferase involved in cell wall biosynthesis
MACLIKPHTPSTKGVVSLTTQERDRLVFGFDDVRHLLERAKQRYVIALHHNWHDYSLKYDELFDFHFAGEEDLREVSGRRVPLVPMDACNFSPDCFYPGASEEKFWDVLFVARAVEFKGIPEFFSAVRRLFDTGNMLRVLFICPLPPLSGPGSMRDVRKLYESKFCGAEQQKFTLLTTDFRYPFPFDLPTLAHFYRASRVFAHSAPDERRCRVAAYAWASGLPVVGMAPVGSVLTPKLRRSPFFFEICSYEEFPVQIVRALDVAKTSPDYSAVQAEVASSTSIELLEEHLRRLFREFGLPAPVGGGWMQGLDIRLGRHHGLPAGVNQLEQDISAFLKFLLNTTPSELLELAKCQDPESEIAKRFPCAARPMKSTQVHRTLQQRAMQVARAVLRG